MGYSLISQEIREDNRLTGIDLAIYYTLATFADENRQCFPSVQTIADMAKFSKSSVKRSLKNLEASGWITIQPRRKNNGQTSNLYTLLDNIKTKKEEKTTQEVKQVQKQTTSNTQEESKIPKQKNPIVSDEYSEAINEVLDYLNYKKGSHSSYIPLDRKFIHTLLNQGYTKDDLILVIEWKAKQWQGKNYRQNLRPTTLFKDDDKHFKKYLNEAKSNINQAIFNTTVQLMDEADVQALKEKLQRSN